MKYLDLFCACGAGLEGEMDDTAAEMIQTFWDKEHSRPGCKPASRQEAVAAYRPKHNNEEPIGANWRNT